LGWTGVCTPETKAAILWFQKSQIGARDATINSADDWLYGPPGHQQFYTIVRGRMREEHPRHPHSLSFADLCWYIQEQAFGGLDADTAKVLEGLARSAKPGADAPRRLKPGIPSS
jgi:hypothetical protein